MDRACVTYPWIAVRISIRIVQWWITPEKLRGNDTHALQGNYELGCITGKVDPNITTMVNLAISWFSLYFNL